VEGSRRPVNARIRRTGQLLTTTVARAPWLWPLLRAPMRRYFAERAPIWDEETSAGTPEHLTALATAVSHVDAEPERILDIGTGTGVAALFLAREYARASVRGVDMVEEMIARAQAKIGLDPTGRVAFKVADAGNLPFPDAHFDLVTQVNVPVFFAEVARVLRPGGSVVVVSSYGSGTPFFTPHPVLARRFRRQRIVAACEGETAGGGTYWIGRRE
jgi:SAM-dependent methyltransferase